jgi:hypothetical protein
MLAFVQELSEKRGVVGSVRFRQLRIKIFLLQVARVKENFCYTCASESERLEFSLLRS